MQITTLKEMLKLKRGDVIRNNSIKLEGIVTENNSSGNYGYIYTLNKTNKVVGEYFHYANIKNYEVITDEKTVQEYTELFANFYKTEGFRQLRHNVRSLGSDPEIFIVDGKGKMIPSFKFLKSKDDKTNRGRTSGQSIFWDGFQAEFNITADSCLNERTLSTSQGLFDLLTLAKEYNKDAELSVQTTFDIDPQELQDSAPEHVAFGCMPSLNIYGHEGLKADGRDVPFRSAGGHIHFGISNLLDKETKNNKEIVVGRIVKSLDAILGVACVSLFEKYDDPRRRSMYGLAGEYRLPKHGIEYRTLSNAWLADPLIMNIVFELSRRALQVGYENLLSYWDATEEETIHCINTCDVALSREILARNKKMFVDLIFSLCRDQEKSEQIYKIFMYGMDSILPDATKVTNNWKLMNAQKNRGAFAEGMRIYTMQKLPKYKELLEDNSVEIYEQLIKDIQGIELEEKEVVEEADFRRAI